MNIPFGKARYKEMVDSSDRQYIDDIIFVGASTANDKIWGHHSSNITYNNGSVYGPLVDVFAPGEAIRGAKHSTERSFSALDTWNGTSFVGPDNEGNPTQLNLPNYLLRRHPTSLESSLVCSATLLVNIKILPQDR